jgi:hypothetical protein
MNRATSGRTLRAVLCGLLVLGLAGCNEAQPKPKKYIEVPKKPELTPNARPGEETTQGKPRGGAPGAAPSYLPPSERGARVEVTEAPEGSPPPQNTSNANPQAQGTRQAGAGAAKSPGAGAKGAGDAGGNMPTTAGAPTYQAPPGTRQPEQPTNQSMGVVQPVDQDMPESKLPPAPFLPEPGGAAAQNQKLKEQMREFDAAMQRAQQEAARERGGKAGPQAADIDRGASGAPGRSTGTGNMPGEKHGDARSDDPRALATGARPTDPGKGEAENIVAKQLRQAAEREQDPVLREKLWAEYRRYVGGTGAK